MTSGKLPIRAKMPFHGILLLFSIIEANNPKQKNQ